MEDVDTGQLTETIAKTIEAIQAVDEVARAAASSRQDLLTKPRGSLGMLETLSIRLAGIYGEAIPTVPAQRAVVVMAADHGVAAKGVSLFPAEVTPQMVMNFGAGGAAINAVAASVGAEVVVVDVGVAADLPASAGHIDRKVRMGTADMTEGPAMSREEAMQAIEAGIAVANDLIDRGVALLCTGDMGIGNTTPSAAITSVFTSRPPAEVTGRGTGVDDLGLDRKVAAIELAIEVNEPSASDPIGALAAVGGLEIAGLTGVIMAAASRRVPVVIDGFISGAAALAAAAIAPGSVDYMIAGHRSVERGHTVALGHLGLEPILDLGMRLGEGTGATLAVAVIDASLRILLEMATFETAGVSGEDS